MTPLWNLSPLILAASKDGGPPVTPYAQDVVEFHLFGFLPITNSMIFTIILTLVLAFVAWLATRNISEVPSGLQNFFEWIIEGLESVMGDLLEPKVVRWVFPFIATFFIFILASNLTGLLPGVGSIGWLDHDSGHTFLGIPTGHVGTPLFRPPTADANMTLAMATIFFFACWWWTVKYNGPVGTVNHIFGPKGGFKGWQWWALLIIFVPIGVLELVSILIRPVALAARLFGNIYGGENVLTIMLTMNPVETMGYWGAVLLNVLVSLPFYFLELLVAVVQTLVFVLLCVAFTASLCSHTDGDHHDEEGAAAH